MIARIPVYVFAPDSITAHGLVAQLRTESALAIVDRAEVGADTVIVAAADVIDDGTLRELRGVNQGGARRCVLITGTLDDIALLNAIEVGVCALVRRPDATPARLVSVITKAARGEAALPPDVLANLLTQVSRLHHNVLTPRGLTIVGLTPREADVLRLVADGMDTDEVAVNLCYSPRTVKNILQGVMTRFCLRNRTHAVAYALREGLI